MSVLIEVGISGTVGKQVFAANRPAVLKSVVLNSTVSAGVLVLRDGNSSGEVKLTLNRAAGGSDQREFCGVRFDKGIHAKVTGTGSLCYLEIE